MERGSGEGKDRGERATIKCACSNGVDAISRAKFASNRSKFVKIILSVLLALVVISLFSGLYFVYKDKGNSKRAVNALTIRIGLSVFIIILVIVSYFVGWLPPK